MFPHIQHYPEMTVFDFYSINEKVFNTWSKNAEKE